MTTFKQLKKHLLKNPETLAAYNALQYEINKQYWFGDEYWICALLTSKYATFVAVRDERRQRMVRIWLSTDYAVWWQIWLQASCYNIATSNEVASENKSNQNITGDLSCGRLPSSTGAGQSWGRFAWRHHKQKTDLLNSLTSFLSSYHGFKCPVLSGSL